MKELSIEKAETIIGGCSMEEMMSYGFLTGYYASVGNTILSVFYGVKMISCM